MTTGNANITVTAHDPDARQVGGSHYQTGGLQHWDLAVLFDWDPFQYQVTKYVMRWRDKNGLLDLEKDQHFIEKYLQEVRAGRIDNSKRKPLQRSAWLAMLHAVDAGDYARLGKRLGDTLKELYALRGQLAMYTSGKVKPTGWVGFTFEGAKDSADEFRCTKCSAHFNVPCNTSPLVHTCDDVDKTFQALGVTRPAAPTDLQLEAPLATHTDGTEPGRTYVSPD